MDLVDSRILAKFPVNCIQTELDPIWNVRNTGCVVVVEGGLGGRAEEKESWKTYGQINRGKLSKDTDRIQFLTSSLLLSLVQKRFNQQDL